MNFAGSEPETSGPQIVAGSARTVCPDCRWAAATARSPATATQTSPSPTATARGVLPSGMTRVTRFVFGHTHRPIALVEPGQFVVNNPLGYPRQGLTPSTRPFVVT